MPFRYLAFYKPYGVLSQFTEAPLKPGLGRFIPVPDVYPVGRLDFDSEGLLLLTDDGPLQHRVAHPKFGHERTYWVQVEGEIAEPALERLRRGGLAIQDYRTQPCKVTCIAGPELLPREPPIRFRKAIPTSWLNLSLTEGRNRQVRRMTAAVGYPTLRLVRYAIGAITLDGLEPGQWRDLSRAEVTRLRG